MRHCTLGILTDGHTAPQLSRQTTDSRHAPGFRSGEAYVPEQTQGQGGCGRLREVTRGLRSGRRVAGGSVEVGEGIGSRYGAARRAGAAAGGHSAAGPRGRCRQGVIRLELLGAGAELRRLGACPAAAGGGGIAATAWVRDGRGAWGCAAHHHDDQEAHAGR